MSKNICETCGQLHEFCFCDDNPESNIAQERRERSRLEEHQDFHGLSNDEMTDFTQNLNA